MRAASLYSLRTEGWCLTRTALSDELAERLIAWHKENATPDATGLTVADNADLKDEKAPRCSWRNVYCRPEHVAPDAIVPGVLEDGATWVLPALKHEGIWQAMCAMADADETVLPMGMFINRYRGANSGIKDHFDPTNSAVLKRSNEREKTGTSLVVAGKELRLQRGQLVVIGADVKHGVPPAVRSSTCPRVILGIAFCPRTT